jgi:hypothetical protein
MKDSQDRAAEVFSAGTRDSPQTGKVLQREEGDLAVEESCLAAD